MKDLQVGFGYLSRIRGKKQDATLAHNEMVAKYERMLFSDDGESEGKKRKRDKVENDEEGQNKAAKGDYSFSTKQKV